MKMIKLKNNFYFSNKKINIIFVSISEKNIFVCINK